MMVSGGSGWSWQVRRFLESGSKRFCIVSGANDLRSSRAGGLCGSDLVPERRHKLPAVGLRVVTLHRVQLVAVVPPPHGVDVPAHHTHAVVGVLVLQWRDGAPAVVTGVVPATGAAGKVLLGRLGTCWHHQTRTRSHALTSSSWSRPGSRRRCCRRRRGR